MLSFLAEFPVDESKSSGDFLRAVKEWIVGSPHTRLKAQDIGELGANGQWSTTKANESVVSLRGAKERVDSSAVRYRRVDDELEWTTTVTFSNTDGDAWVAVRVLCESQHPAARLPPAKKPVLVRTLLEALRGGLDGALQVQSAPHLLDQREVDKAARLIVGTAHCRLPIVYVSSTYDGGHILDVKRLASDLAGMAHVVVEPNRHFSFRLKLEANSENVYGGTIGIYWPDGGGRRSFFIGKSFEKPADLAKAIFEEIRSALTNRRPLECCTWASTQELVSRQVFDDLKASGSKEVDKYVEVFGKELSSKDELLLDAEREIGRLKAELRIYQSRLPASSGTTLRTGGEQDLYPNEIPGIMLDALRDYVGRVPADSRRRHVLEALISANEVDSESDNLKERLKEILRGVRGIDRKVKQGLEALGFEITEEGKHYKLVFQGDERYTFSFQKSGSDHRGGLNAASDIGRLLF